MRSSSGSLSIFFAPGVRNRAFVPSGLLALVVRLGVGPLVALGVLGRARRSFRVDEIRTAAKKSGEGGGSEEGQEVVGGLFHGVRQVGRPPPALHGIVGTALRA